MAPFFSKKVKAEMRSRKRRKKATGTETDGDGADHSQSISDRNVEKPSGIKRTADEIHSTHQGETQSDKPHSHSKKSKLNGENLSIVVPRNLTPKEAKKFRKDERRKARANGQDEEKIKFTNEGEEKDEFIAQDADTTKTSKKPKKKSFPRINELITQHATQQKLAEQAAKRNALNDAVPHTEKQKYVAIDCEMVGIGTSGAKSALARASAVDWDGNILLDTFVRVPERVTDFRTNFSGVRPKDIHVKNENAMNHSDVRNEMEKLLVGKILVGHALKNDLSVLMISHPRSDTRDTAKYKPFMRLSGRAGGKMRPRKLRDLVYENLGKEIQKKGEGHCSIEDARASMELFKSVRGRWEKELVKGGSKRGTK